MDGIENLLLTAVFNWLENRYDDLLEEENDVAQKALKRLNNRESYERIYRIRRAVQCSYQHKLLPKDQWTTTAQVRKIKNMVPVDPRQWRHGS